MKTELLVEKLRHALADFIGYGEQGTIEACALVDHKKGDYHSSDEPCPVVMRYRQLLKEIKS